jgi:mRNA interferase MazF
VAYIGPVYRWDIYWADLDPTVGSEQSGDRRPVIVVSNDGVNKSLSVITVVSVTKLEAKKRKPYTFEVLLPKGTVTNKYASIVMPQQIRAISKSRLLEKIGTLDNEDFRTAIENRLLEHLDIEFERDDET